MKYAALAICLILALAFVGPASATLYISQNYTGNEPTNPAVTGGAAGVSGFGFLYNTSGKNITPTRFQLNPRFHYVGAYSGTTKEAEVAYYEDAAKTHEIARIEYTLVPTSDLGGGVAASTLEGTFTLWEESYFSVPIPGDFTSTYHTVIFDNISDGINGNGISLPFGVADTEINGTIVRDEIGLVFVTSLPAHHYTVKNEDRRFYLWAGAPTPPGVETCEIPVEVRDFRTGALIGGSTFTIEDHDSIWNVTKSLPYGSGKVDFPVDSFDHTVETTGSAPGYTSDGWIYPPDSITCDSTLIVQLFVTQVSGANCTMTYGVYDYKPDDVYNGTMEAIPGATVKLLNGERYTGITGSAGTVPFTVNSTFLYNYSVSAPGYNPFLSDATCDGWADHFETVFLTVGTIPTATTTTPATPHDTTGEALAFPKENALALVVLLFVATIVGILKLIAKW